MAGNPFACGGQCLGPHVSATHPHYAGSRFEQSPGSPPVAFGNDFGACFVRRPDGAPSMTYPTSTIRCNLARDDTVSPAS